MKIFAVHILASTVLTLAIIMLPFLIAYQGIKDLLTKEKDL